MGWSARALDGATDEPVPAGPDDLEIGSYVLDIDGPMVVEPTSPAEGATGVAVNQNIQITFNEAVNPATFAYTIWPAVAGIVETWSGGDTIFTIIDHNDFSVGTQYFVNITALEDVVGNPLDPMPYAFNFTTIVVVVDTTAPTSSVSALATYQNSLTFNIEITASDSSGSVEEVELWYQVDSGGWSLYNAYPFSGSAKTISFTAVADGVYEFYSRAKDDSDNWESAPSSRDAQTAADTTAPVVDTGPDISANGPFNLDPTQIDTGSGIASYVWEVISGSGGVIFTETRALTTISATADGTYVIRLTVTDNAGNSAYDEFTFVWDTTPPTVSTAPSGVNITVDTVITVTFNELVDQSSAEDAFSIGPNVAGNFSWNAVGTVMTFTPTNPLVYSTEYTVTIAGNTVEDILGNKMVNATSKQFTTEAQSAAVEETGDIEGQILDESGLPIAGALVEVTVDGEIYSAVTDENGNFTIFDIPVGTHDMQVTKDDMGETIPVTIDEDQTTTVPPINLVPEPPEQRKQNWWWLLLIFIAVIVAILMLATMIRKAGKDKE